MAIWKLTAIIEADSAESVFEISEEILDNLDYGSRYKIEKWWVQKIVTPEDE